MSQAFCLDNVSFTYALRDFPALEQLSLIIPEGKTTALLGPNGAGKSTLMDLLLRWKIPDSGSILLFGQPLKNYSKLELGRTISLVPQDEHSRFSFTVLDYVLFGRSPYLHQLASPSQNDVHIAVEAVKEVGLSDLTHRVVTQLSGGEYQLLLLARALAQQPRILLLDEPTSSLDPGHTAMVLRILKRLANNGITLFFTTHDPSIAAEMAQHVAMMKQGHILFSGDMETTLTAPRLSTLYGTPMETVQSHGRLLVTRV